MSSISKRKLPLRQLRSILPLSPKSKKIKQKHDRATQEEAVDDILVQQAANAGEVPFGVIQSVIDAYVERGFGYCINRNIIDYRLKLRRSGKRMQ